MLEDTDINPNLSLLGGLTKVKVSIQGQPTEVFYEKRCSYKFRKFTGKHLWKHQAFRPAALLRKTPTQVFPCEICKTFMNTYFVKDLQPTPSESEEEWENVNVEWGAFSISEDNFDKNL